MPEEFPTLNDPVSTGTVDSSTTGTSADFSDTPPQGGDKSADGSQTKNANEPIDQIPDKADQQKGDKTTEEDLSRFDKHPRFQELIKTKEDLTIKNAQLEAQYNLLSQQIKELRQPAQTQQTVEQPAFDKKLGDLAKKLDDGDMSMSEYMNEYTKIIEARTEQRVQALQSEQEKTISMSKMENEFLSKNPDYLEVVNGGKLEAIKMANPLHDNISAYYEYKAQQASQSLDEKVKEAVDKAVKQTQEEMIKNFKAKGRADVLGQGPSSAPQETGKEDARLKDPKRFGGNNTVLAARLARRRSERSSGM